MISTGDRAIADVSPIKDYLTKQHLHDLGNIDVYVDDFVGVPVHSRNSS